jgi:pimeloyl-ACP methyl ester carboxylesterase
MRDASRGGIAVGMTSQIDTTTHHRQQLLAGLPVVERRLDIGGIPTAILEGGAGAPIVLLHGPGAYGAHWMRVIPELVTRYRVVAPDLPGHGASGTGDGPLDAARVVAWLRDLIAVTCAAPPALIGHAFGGAIAARFAAAHPDQVRRIVLVDTFGLTALQPVPAFARAIDQFVVRPDVESHLELWRYCAHDIDRVRREMGDRWASFEAYNVGLLRTPSVKSAFGALMAELAPPLPPDELARITVPTDLVWGREDLATPLAVAEAASRRYRWPLHVIDGAADDPAIEAPAALVRILGGILAGGRR